MKEITNESEFDESELSYIPESNLTILQQKAIFALLTSRTIEQAARSAGCTSRAIFYWLERDVEFQSELHSMQSGIINQSATQLVNAQSNILEKLEGLVNDSADEKIVIEAGKVLLEYITRWYELTRVNSKLNRIEQMLEENE